MFRWLRNSFLTGVVVALPVTVTIWLIYAFVNFVDQTVKPLIPERYNPESYLPFAIPGLGHHDVAQAAFQVGHVLGQAEDGHDL